MQVITRVPRRRIVRVRSPRDDELYVMMVFERHASHCEHCKDPLHAYEAGHSLCVRGEQCAVDVAAYLYNKHGDTYSVVGREGHRSERIKIYRDYPAVRGLLLAVESGMVLPRKRLELSPPDRTYTVRPVCRPSSSSSSSSPPPQPDQQQPDPRYVRVIDRGPRDLKHKRRRVTVYHTIWGSRLGYRYDSDVAVRVKLARTYVRVYRPGRYCVD